ncbi:hypothetical protein [Chitinimonas lacunae]|uniref:Thioredoxin domain-containing protein n=1 Tax=Chitinimonas lacunae TaxID=1963018 RepID=A0ABV8MQK5_9NEIS
MEAQAQLKPPVQPGRNRLTLIALIAVALAPVVLSYLAYYVWKPSGGRSYGQLLEVRPLPDFPLASLDGKPARLDEFRRKWLLVMVDDAACGKDCMDALFALRQYRLSQGKEMHRIERLWLVTGEGQPSAAALRQADGAAIRRALAPVPLPGELQRGIYLIDPLGNQVVRYPRDAETGRVIKELVRFLKNNESLG